VRAFLLGTRCRVTRRLEGIREVRLRRSVGASLPNSQSRNSGRGQRSADTRNRGCALSRSRCPFIRLLLSRVAKMHTIERSTARMAFHLDERLEKVQSDGPVRFRGHIGELGEGFVRNEFSRATIGNTSTRLSG